VHGAGLAAEEVRAGGGGDVTAECDADDVGDVGDGDR
jgi:hypothetical protein